MMMGRNLSRLHICLVLTALALCGCGDNEATQRRAFIEFLQIRIVNKPGIHVPHLTTDETAAFGPYAKHYAIIVDFNAALDDAVSKPMQQALKNGTPHSLAEVMARRKDIAAVWRGHGADSRSTLPGAGKSGHGAYRTESAGRFEAHL